ncbi:MOSC domain-containing protein [Actinokineospora auranticolor]|uniref:MOSC N-terminal beta barrel domain-containing protein n=1 Tax=Actinokineospora auranticolor TaxID=155976 RepID=UPI001FE24B80|nr:MOSC N-terminal beta barrel domain-containing protein [Actinokineospora auranticolor]
MATVSALTYYPVKGFSGVPVTTAETTETGLLDDRLLMVVEASDGSFVSQRKLPAMAAVQAALSNNRLTLTAPNTDEFELDLTHTGPEREVSLFNRWFGPAVDQGDPAAKWCSTTLNRDVRLVRVPPNHDREGWGTHPGKVGFGDAHAILMTSDSSLADLNTRIETAGATPIPMDRFRANIEVTGWPDPYTEDRVHTLTIGTTTLGFSTQAVRCAVPTVDQRTGAKTGPEPTRTLATYRRHPTRPGVTFGAKLAILTPGTLRVGDDVHVSEWQ